MESLALFGGWLLSAVIGAVIGSILGFLIAEGVLWLWRWFRRPEAVISNRVMVSWLVLAVIAGLAFGLVTLSIGLGQSPVEVVQWLFMEIFAQAAWIASTFGLIQMWNMGSRRAWAPYLGLGNQVFWFLLALHSHEYGLIPACLAYTVVHGRNAWKWRLPRLATAAPSGIVGPLYAVPSSLTIAVIGTPSGASGARPASL